MSVSLPHPTLRGVTLLVAGGSLAAAASAIGEPDLAAVGVALVGIVVLGLLITWLARPVLGVTRSTALEIPVGSPLEEHLTVSNTSRLALSGLQFHDVQPAGPGTDARFSLLRGMGAWEQTVNYQVDATLRGHYRQGPLLVRAFDPFGVASHRWQVPEEPSRLRVTPRIWPVTGLPNRAGTGAAGEATPQRVGQAGQDDILVREHRQGDDLRRVHWRMTAKQGDLMVRLEEHPWDPAATLVVDVRSSAHFGRGTGSTLEWAVSMCASVGVYLLRRRHLVTVVAPESTIHTPTRLDMSVDRDRLVAALTDLKESRTVDLGQGLSDTEAIGNHSLVIAVLGKLGAADASALTAVGSRAGSAVALAPDVASFGLTGEAARMHDEACRLLESSGWTVHRYVAGEGVPDAWQALVERSRVR